MSNEKLLQRVYPNSNDEIKRRILKHAAICFCNGGLEGTSINKIRKEAKVSTGTIYYYFNNKEGVIAHLAFAAIDDLFYYRKTYLLNATNFKESIYALVLSYVDWMTIHPNFAQILLSAKFEINLNSYQSEMAEHKKKYQTKLKEWLQLPVNKSTLNNLPFDLFSSMVNGIPEHYCKYWILGHVKESPHFYRDDIANATWRAINDFGLDKSA